MRLAFRLYPIGVAFASLNGVKNAYPVYSLLLGLAFRLFIPPIADVSFYERNALPPYLVGIAIWLTLAVVGFKMVIDE